MTNRRRYPEEFKRDAVRLLMARGSRTAEDVAKGLGLRANQLYRWQKKYGPEVAGASGQEDNSAELTALRWRNRQLEMENALLKKAAAFFAKESL
jgi:transposase-like protein